VQKRYFTQQIYSKVMYQKVYLHTYKTFKTLLSVLNWLKLQLLNFLFRRPTVKMAFLVTLIAKRPNLG